MKRRDLKPQEVFWLARYAHNKLSPVFDRVREKEPSAREGIDMGFDQPGFGQGFMHVTVKCHWARAGMFSHDICLTTSDEVDRLAMDLDLRATKLEAAA